jgi:ERCC4-type nuclease
MLKFFNGLACVRVFDGALRSTFSLTVVRRIELTIGDYAVERNGTLVAVVERKGLEDFVATLTGGKLRYLLAALASVEHSALVVEER